MRAEVIEYLAIRVILQAGSQLRSTSAPHLLRNPVQLIGGILKSPKIEKTHLFL